MPEQALWLHHTIRSVEWHKGREDKEARKLNTAVEMMRASVMEIIDDITIKTVKDVESLLAGRVVAWLILESVIKHEWF